MHAEHPRQQHQTSACGREIFKLLISCDREQGQHWSTRKTPPKRGKFVQVGVILKTAEDRGGPGSRLASPCMLDATQLPWVQSKTRIVFDEATEARPEMPAGVDDRDADIWEPLLAVADIAGGDWPKQAREAAKALVAVAREVEPSLNIRLLADLRTVFGDEEQLTTKKIIAELCLLEDAPWNDLKGKPITDNHLARRLRQYGVKSKTLRLDDDHFAKGYARADLHDAWRRYLPSSPTSDKPVTAVTFVTEPISCGFDVTPVTAQGSNVTAGEPNRASNPVTPVTAQKEACDGSGNARSAHEMRVVTPVTPVTPFPGNGRGARTDGSATDLSPRTIAKLAEDYTETTYCLNQEGADVDSASLDADLRQQLADMGVLPEFVEVEFERVMAEVFRVYPLGPAGRS